MLIEDKDKDAYTYIIKKFRPEPTDDPARLGKFAVYFDDGKFFIVSEQPLTLDELMNIEKKGEFYATQEFAYVSKKYIKDLIDNAYKIHYYTKNKVVLEFFDSGSGDRCVVRIQLQPVYKNDELGIELFNAKIEAYVNGVPTKFRVKPSEDYMGPRAILEEYYSFSRDDVSHPNVVNIVKRFREASKLFGKEIKLRIYSGGGFNIETSWEKGYIAFAYNYGKALKEVAEKLSLPRNEEEGCYEVSIHDPRVDQILDALKDIIKKLRG